MIDWLVGRWLALQEWWHDRRCTCTAYPYGREWDTEFDPDCPEHGIGWP